MSKGRIVELIAFIIFKAAVIQANPGMASPWMMAITSDPSPEKIPLSTTISQVLFEEILLCQRKGALSLFLVKQRQNACADPGSKVQERSHLWSSKNSIGSRSFARIVAWTWTEVGIKRGIAFAAFLSACRLKLSVDNDVRLY